MPKTEGRKYFETRFLTSNRRDEENCSHLSGQLSSTWSHPTSHFKVDLEVTTCKKVIWTRWNDRFFIFNILQRQLTSQKTMIQKLYMWYCPYKKLKLNNWPHLLRLRRVCYDVTLEDVGFRMTTILRRAETYFQEIS